MACRLANEYPSYKHTHTYIYDMPPDTHTNNNKHEQIHLLQIFTCVYHTFKTCNKIYVCEQDFRVGTIHSRHITRTYVGPLEPVAPGNPCGPSGPEKQIIGSDHGKAACQ
jgi:hypothetical protein